MAPTTCNAAVLTRAFATPTLWAALALAAVTPAQAAGDRTESDEALSLVAGLPLAFEANAGQTDPAIDFLARGPGYGLWLSADRATIAVRGTARDDRNPRSAKAATGGPAASQTGGSADAAIALTLVDSTPAARSRGLEPLPGVSNYLSIDGTTPNVTGVEHFGRIHYDAVYPGIDLEYYGRDGALEYDFIVAAGADPSAIAIAITGHESLAVDTEGQLRIGTAAGELVQRAPYSYQIGDDGSKIEVPSHFVLDGDRLSFALADYDRGRALVIDPVFSYATYIGGSAEDRAYDIFVNAAGEAYITGQTRSTNLPTVGAIQPNSGGFNDAYLVKLSADGSAALISTYLGGANEEEGLGLTVDGSGNIIIVGTVYSGYPNGYTGFETKLGPAANAVIYSRTIPATPGDTFPQRVRTDSSGNTYIVGSTSSATFPLVNAIQPYMGGDKGFIRKLAPDGTVLVSTYLGNSSAAVSSRGLGLDAAGNIYIVGTTANIDPLGQIYVLKMPPALNAVNYSKQFGGNSSDAGSAIAVLADGTCYVAGSSESTNFPIVGGAFPTHSGSSDMVLIRVDPAGTLTASTFYGGADYDYGTAIAVDGAGRVHVAASVETSLFVNEAVITRWPANFATAPALAQYRGSSYILAEAIATGTGGTSFVASRGQGTMPTTTGAWRTGNPGDQNGHVAKIDWATQPTLTITDRSRSEGTTGNANFDFVISASTNAAGPISFTATTANGTAIAGSDYVAQSTPLTMPVGTRNIFHNVSVLGDYINEPNETFSVNLTGVSGATLADGSALGTIVNDDQPNGQIHMEAAARSVSEGVGEADLRVQRSNGSWGPVGVNYSTANGTATAGSDYTAQSGMFQWNDQDGGEWAILVPIAVNNIDEPDETFTITLSQPTGGAALIAPITMTVTIVDDDPPPTVSIADRACAEGNTGTSNCALTISLSTASGKAISGTISTANGTAIAGSDYNALAAAAWSIAAGQTQTTVNLVVRGDTLDEDNEALTATLAGLVNVSAGDTSALVSITDDDAFPAVSIADRACAEGNTGTSNCALTISLSTASGKAISGTISTANGTAIAGSDYNALIAGPWSIIAGQTQTTVNLVVRGDMLDEDNETLTATLAGLVNVNAGDISAAITITDDDAFPAVSIADRACAEGNTGTSNCALTISLSAASGKAISGTISTANGTATAGSDYNALAAVPWAIAVGQSQTTVNLVVRGDTLDEDNETLTATLAGLVNVNAGDISAAITISDDDAAPTVSIADRACAEGNTGTSTCAVTITLSAASGKAISGTISSANGTAIAGSDYNALAAAAWSIAAGQTQTTLNLVVRGDTLDEDNETLTATLAGLVNVSAGDISAAITITDDDAFPAVSIADRACAEGNAGTSNCALTITLSAASGKAISGTISTANVTALAGSDYNALAAAAWSIAAGQTQTTVNLVVRGDTLDEDNETLTATLAGLGNVNAGDTSAMITITDDDAAPTVSIADRACAEGNSGTSSCALTISLTAASAKLISGTASSADGTAVAGNDYDALNGVAWAIPAGQSQATVNVVVRGDTGDEADETLTVMLANLMNATGGTTPASLTIVDDDGATANPGTLRFANCGLMTVGEQVGQVSVGVERIGGSDGAISVNYATVAGSATAGDDFLSNAGQLSWDAGDSGQRTITLSIVDDLDFETTENFFAIIDAPSGGATVGTPDECELRITDNDPPERIFANGFEGSQ